MWDNIDPDPVVLDIDFGPDVNGFNLADAFLTQRPELAVPFLSSLPDARFAGRSAGSLPVGAGYVHKDQLANANALVIALVACRL